MDPYQNPSHFLIPNPSTSTDHYQEQEEEEEEEHHRHRDRDRLPQWSPLETRELLSIRSELDTAFVQTKRNKPLWEAIAARMQHKGFVRTPDQCKSKWKNLVTRYKGSEAMEGDRSFAFREEMKRIFENRMERLLSVDPEKGEEEKHEKKKKKKRREGDGEVEEALREFMRKQMETERRWIEAAEARERERRSKEEEWRRQMAAMGKERMEVERRWRAREEERRAREEEREERRHVIVTAILEKIAEKGF